MLIVVLLLLLDSGVMMTPKRQFQPRSQGLFPGLGAGREKVLASAGHVPTLHPETLGVINKRVYIIKSVKIEFAEKLSLLFDLDLLINIETLHHRFVQL